MFIALDREAWRAPSERNVPCRWNSHPAPGGAAERGVLGAINISLLWSKDNYMSSYAKPLQPGADNTIPKVSRRTVVYSCS